MSKISIVIPTYQRPELLPIAIESALASERPAGYPEDWREIIVVSDGDPGAREIAMGYPGVIYDELPENSGQGAVLNHALNNIVRGDYMTVLHDDDYIYANKFQVLAPYLDCHAEAGMVCSQVDCVDGDGVIIEDLTARKQKRHTERGNAGITRESERESNSIAGAACLYRRAMCVEVGGWREDLCHGEELHIHLMCLRYGWTIGFSDIITGVYRIYAGNKSRDPEREQLKYKALAMGKEQRAQIDLWEVNIVIASIASRRHGLKQVVEQFRDKSERMYLALYGYDEIPDFAVRPNITVRLSDDGGANGMAKNNGTADKFTWFEEIKQTGGGYVIHMDDDVLYPDDYVAVMRQAVDRYRRKAIVCAHGSLVTASRVNNYYEDRVCLHFKKSVLVDEPVHVPGMICAAYHTDTIQLQHSDFMGEHTQDDIYMAVQCQRQKVPVICIARRGMWIQPNPDVTAKGSICDRRSGRSKAKEMFAI